jgi:hypothetical protein
MVYSEAFQEAFDRMERDTNSLECETLKELRLVAKSYFGSKWYPTNRQLYALKDEAKRRGYFDKFREKIVSRPRYPQRQPHNYVKQIWRHETVTVRGKPQTRYRDIRTGRFIKNPNYT